MISSSIWSNLGQTDLPAPSCFAASTAETAPDRLQRAFRDTIDSASPDTHRRGQLPYNADIVDAWSRHNYCQPLIIETAQEDETVSLLIPRMTFEPYTLPDTWFKNSDGVTVLPSPILTQDGHLCPRGPPFEWAVYRNAAHDIINAMVPLDDEHKVMDRLRRLAEQVVTFGLRSRAHTQAAPLLARALIFTLENWCSIRLLDEDDSWSVLAKFFRNLVAAHISKLFEDFWKSVSVQFFIT